MEFAQAAGLTPRLIVLEETASTNDDLSRRSIEERLPEFTTVVTLNQTAGRGRLGRVWQAPPGTSLAISIILHPQEVGLSTDRYGWLPLVAGLAMARTVRTLLPEREVTLKWPNDVLVDSKKISGLLCELLPSGSVVVGAGVNLTIPAEALPVPNATSLMLMGVSAPAAVLPDQVLASYLVEIKALWTKLAASVWGDTDSDIRSLVSAVCSTLGRRVRLALPDGTEQFGVALDLDDAGQLRMQLDSDGSVQSVAAGDVTHLRYE